MGLIDFIVQFVNVGMSNKGHNEVKVARVDYTFIKSHYVQEITNTFLFN